MARTVMVTLGHPSVTCTGKMGSVFTQLAVDLLAYEQRVLLAKTLKIERIANN